MFFFCLLFSPHPPALKRDRTHQPGGPRMRCGMLPTGEPQPFYFADDHPSMPGWFKGMERILHERGLYPEGGLLAQCSRCPPDQVDCCCRRILYHQRDFVNQCSQLQELIESHGHLCDFYPKYHCELNFIEQYWGAAKAQYRVIPQAKTIEEMEKTVKKCLDDVPILQIQRSVFLLLPFPISLPCLGSQIELRVSSPLTEKAFQAHKLCGQTGNTMGIEHYRPMVFSKPGTLSIRRALVLRFPFGLPRTHYLPVMTTARIVSLVMDY